MNEKTKLLPEGEMPRERLLSLGAQALSERELLALLLRTGGGGYPVLDFAAHILQQRGGLVGLLTSRKEQLLPIKGLGQAKIAEILAVAELARRFIAAEMTARHWRFRHADDVRDFLLMHYKGLGNEEMGMLLLDGQHRFLAHVSLPGDGSPGAFRVPMRRLCAEVLHHDAAAVILVHNHPAASRTPSADDRRTTAAIEQLLQTLEVRLLDHFIVGGDTLLSMREQGGW